MIYLEKIALAKADPAFEQDCWLTFYLEGDPKKHANIKPALLALNAVNLGGAEGGTVYAKLPTMLSELAIQERIEQVRSLAEQSNIEIGIVDLDSSADAQSSKFYTLWKATD